MSWGRVIQRKTSGGHEVVWEGQRDSTVSQCRTGCQPCRLHSLTVEDIVPSPSECAATGAQAMM